ncbi:MAG: hypothetical protein IBJ11_02870 [Phycisphaerales bacterium]|nr:hypothetical protein [Phycisphaerales bacterium]
MKTVLRAIFPLIWPCAAPVLRLRGTADRLWWVLASLWVFFPAGAVLHHLFAYRRTIGTMTCILNDLNEAPGVKVYEFTWPVIQRWVAMEPTLPLAGGIAAVTLLLGWFLWPVRLLAAPLYVSTLALSVWTWDIPGTGRWVCMNLHDDRVRLFGGPALRTSHIYMLTLGLFVVAFAATLGPVLKAVLKEQDRGEVAPKG